ncbi:hypothetical protein BSKO_13800 [Bryopsis sp. KO-2023]|nr:hypothetical protein BSKO_13800 [Bryopsis sp. KO-2023]
MRSEMTSDASMLVTGPKRKNKKGKKAKMEDAVAEGFDAGPSGEHSDHEGRSSKKSKKKKMKKKDLAEDIEGSEAHKDDEGSEGRQDIEASEAHENVPKKKSKKRKKKKKKPAEQNGVAGKDLVDTPMETPARKSKQNKEVLLTGETQASEGSEDAADEDPNSTKRNGKRNGEKRHTGEKSEERKSKKRRKSGESSKRQTEDGEASDPMDVEEASDPIEAAAAEDEEEKDKENEKGSKKNHSAEEVIQSQQTPEKEKKAKVSSDTAEEDADQTEELLTRSELKVLWRKNLEAKKVKVKENLLRMADAEYGGEQEMVDEDGKLQWIVTDEAKALLRNGPFSYKEDQKIHEFFEGYAKEMGYDMKDVTSWAFPGRNFQKDIKRTGLWCELARILNRALGALYMRAQRLFLRDDSMRGKKWTKEEMQKLKDLREKYGPKWSKIAQELGRFDRDVRNKYMAMFQDGYRGPWSEEESELLKKCVNKHWNETECDVTMTKIHNLPWAKIAEELGSRDEAQCMRFWYDRLCPSMVVKGDWSLDDDKILFESIWKSGASFEYELDWAKLVPNRNEQNTRLRWVMLRRGVPGRKDMYLREVVDYLTIRDWPDLWSDLQEISIADGDLSLLNKVYRTFKKNNISK